ncbi:MAG TPA: SpoIIE family protein phosphatase [Terriglobales bacterium]|nr:SpoIIE family protein phosphatase [Terriglobales bacterium]
MTVRTFSRRGILLAVAAVFAVATVTYSAIWIYYIRWTPQASLGMEYDAGPPARGRTLFSQRELARSAHMTVLKVHPGSSADRAGFQVGDVVVGINGARLETLNPLGPLARGKPGDKISFLVVRLGTSAPITLTATLDPISHARGNTSWPREIMSRVLSFYPLLFALVGVLVLFLRVEDRNAWLLAMLFAGFITSAPMAYLEAPMVPALRGFAYCYMVLFYGLMPAIFYYFFATFPVPSPIDVHVPWLKHLLLIPIAVVVVPLSIWTLIDGNSHPLWVLNRRLPGKYLNPVLFLLAFMPFVLGLVSLVWSSVSAPTGQARRKTQVIVWGTVVGFTPVLISAFVANLQGKNFGDLPYWSYSFSILALFLIPISFAYAVVKHRVLEIPVLLKRSARYLLVRRGFATLIFLLAVSANVLFTFLLSQVSAVGPKVATSAGVGFGILLAWISAPALRRGTQRIDRAFFREAYDARMILQDLSEKARTVNARRELAPLLALHLDQALHPNRVFVYLEAGNGCLHIEAGEPPKHLRQIRTDTLSLMKLADEGQVREFWTEEDDDGLTSLFGAVEPECVVPIQGRTRSLLGLIVLGARLSEEPYSSEDKQLLASVASQAGIALENIALAEQMAQRLEAEHRIEQEMEIARAVQSRLLPQDTPPLRTLDYAGQCIQARVVGGDYFDYLDLAPGKVGFVVADISGKGISGALLMANLQANLRSQYAVALQDVPRLLHSVNRLFYKNTDPGRYATLFFAYYDDADHRLQYINCGHNPPLLLRDDGQTERLSATATVLGLFEDWECSVGSCELRPGDTLVIYTDGVLEATNAAQEEFGECRLINAARACRNERSADLLRKIADEVQGFSSGEQADDITLLILRSIGE